MPVKENKTAPKSKSLSSRKIARNAGSYLDFSITKKVIHHDNYEALVTKRGYDHARDSLPAEPAREAKAEEPKRSESLHALTVRHGENKRSPHVVRLLGEWEKHAQEAAEKFIPSAKGAASRADNPKWLKEVERLREKAASVYKNKAGRVTIDLLGRKSKKKREAAPRRALTFSGIGAAAGSGFSRAASGLIRWLFEFALSIPLGFLLAFSVLLSLVETFNRGARASSRALGASASWAIQHAFFVVIAIVKAVLVIPIKLAVLAVLGAYRAVSSAGTHLLIFGRAGAEAVKNYASVFSRHPRHLYRKLAAIAIIGAVVMLPVKLLERAPERIALLRGSVLGATAEGYSHIASLDLAAAQTDFSEARASLDSLAVPLRALVGVLPSGQDGLHAIGAGEALASAGEFLRAAVAPSREGTATALLGRMRASLAASLPYLQDAQEHLAAINADAIPAEYQEKFSAVARTLPRLNAAIADNLSLLETFSELLGEAEPKRYAVLFQNNNELRPAGGFIGSLAFVDIEDGTITNMEVPGGGSYDFQGYLSEHVKAPKPLSLINARWELQDANWYPDWPTSAAKVVWFLEHAGYSTVDGVIAVQATTLEKLLEVTGPVEFPERGVTLTSANVLEEIQREVELEYDKSENKPKAYIGELLPKVFEKLLGASGTGMMSALGLLQSEITEKNILLYFKDADANRAFAERGWQPSIIPAGTDYLSVIHANIGGGKTDGVISESWSQEVVIDAEGNAAAELTITREHRGNPSDPFTGANNVDYGRVYVPAGSELLSFTGTKSPEQSLFETPQVYYQDDEELAEIEGRVIIDEASGTRITNEFGKTVFGNWLQVAPGAVVVAKVRYKLPFKITPFDLLNPNAKSGYSLILQKQAGARGIPYSVSLRYPSGWKISWSKAAGKGRVDVLGPGLAVFEGELSQDTGFAVSFE